MAARMWNMVIVSKQALIGWAWLSSACNSQRFPNIAQSRLLAVRPIQLFHINVQSHSHASLQVNLGMRQYQSLRFAISR